MDISNDTKNLWTNAYKNLTSEQIRDLNAIVSFPYHVDFADNATEQEKNDVLDPLWRKHLAKLGYTVGKIETFITERHNIPVGQCLEIWHKVLDEHIKSHKLTTEKII